MWSHHWCLACFWTDARRLHWRFYLLFLPSLLLCLLKSTIPLITISQLNLAGNCKSIKAVCHPLRNADDIRVNPSLCNVPCIIYSNIVRIFMSSPCSSSPPPYKFSLESEALVFFLSLRDDMWDVLSPSLLLSSCVVPEASASVHMSGMVWSGWKFCSVTEFREACIWGGRRLAEGARERRHEVETPSPSGAATRPALCPFCVRTQLRDVRRGIYGNSMH